MEKKRIELVLPGKTPGVFCDGVQYGDLLFTSGTAPRQADGTIYAPGDVIEQTKFIFNNIKTLLEMVGSTPDDIIKMNLYLKDMNDRLRIADIRKEFTKNVKIAACAVQICELADSQMCIEADVVAVAHKLAE